MWFVNWNVIYYKSLSSIIPLSLPQKVTSTSEPILFSSQHAPFLPLWNILPFFMNYSSTSSLIWLPFLLRFSTNAFLQFLKVITHALCKPKCPYKVGWNKCMRKKRPTKARSPFYERWIPVKWDNLFSYKQILIFQ